MLNTERNHSSLNQHARGFSIIELMIALLIGLIVLSGVLSIVINSKRSFLDHQAMSQIQENARYALDTLSREIRMAGYFGCAPLEKGAINTSAVGSIGGYLVNSGQAIVPLVGFDNGQSFPTQISDASNGTDAIMIRRVDVEKEYRVVNAPVLAANRDVLVDGTAAIAKGMPVVLVAPGCDSGVLFNASEAVTASTIKGLPQGVNLKNFVAGARLAPVLVNTYYIGNSTAVTGSPALKRESIISTGSGLDTRADELAIGIENLQLEYGTLDSGVVTYKPATAANLAAAPTLVADAVAVRIKLLMRSQLPVHNQAVSYTFEGTNYNDRFLRQQVSATVQLRNRG